MARSNISMKEYMMITGAKILDQQYTEITLIPISLIKKKSLQLNDLITNDLNTIINEITGQKQHETHIPIRNENFASMGLKIGSRLMLEINKEEL